MFFLAMREANKEIVLLSKITLNLDKTSNASKWGEQKPKPHQNGLAPRYTGEVVINKKLFNVQCYLKGLSHKN